MQIHFNMLTTVTFALHKTHLLRYSMESSNSITFCLIVAVTVSGAPAPIAAPDVVVVQVINTCVLCVLNYAFCSVK